MQNQKLLSHRIKGFGNIPETENSLSNLTDALNYNNLPFIEIDVRLSKDRKIHIYHDPYYKIDSQKNYLHKTSSEKLSKQGILTLREFIRIWKESGNITTRLCIDIKDYGCEEQILEILKEYNFSSEVFYITWIPKSIFKLDELKVKNIYFSYYPTNNIILTQLFNFFPKFSFIAKPTYYHLTGIKYSLDDHPEHVLGYQRVVVTRTVPQKISDILVKSGGGVCIERKFITQDYLKELKSLRFKIWIFGLKNNDEYYELSTNNLIDVVFSEDAKSVLLKR